MMTPAHHESLNLTSCIQATAEQSLIRAGRNACRCSLTTAGRLIWIMHIGDGLFGKFFSARRKRGQADNMLALAFLFAILLSPGNRK
jgi:hypothetical protein